MKVKDARDAMAPFDKGQRFNITIRVGMGVRMVLEDVTIRRGPQYVKRFGSFTIRAGMRGHKNSIPVKVHEITEIVPR